MSTSQQPATIGAEFDYLATQEPDVDPLCRRTEPTKRSAVVATMRDEGLVILEWVAHYQALGFDTIVVYTNDNTDGSDDLLLALHRAGVINWIRNVVPGELSPQLKAYRHAFWFSPEVARHDWVMFIDADEFLIPLRNGTLAQIGDYIEQIEALGASSISLNWQWFAGAGEFAPSNGLLAERYRDALPHDHVKTLFRLRDAASIDAHHAELVDGLAVNGDGQPRTSTLPHLEEPAWKLGHINHYWNRSFQEYYVKRQRGRGVSDRTLRDISAFFSWGRIGHIQRVIHPRPEHLSRVRAGIDSLRSLPGVADAERAVAEAFRRRVGTPEVRAMFDQGLAAQAAEMTGPPLPTLKSGERLVWGGIVVTSPPDGETWPGIE
ncbi:glycosyltransferase family 2 protein [Devosia sp.]|jgi:hypothetical protein|uniref:glycosyltransferase family 2 protein n=1 Tax=Devosia sp. TaxID=1871048 RepID=UPI003F6F72D7